MLNSEENRNKIFHEFPELKNDESFFIEYGDDPDYNCIAWAALRDDVFWSPLPLDKRPIQINGVSIDWPFGVANDNKLSTLVEIFRKLKYLECSDGEYEEGFRKIALYGIDEVWTHAARQINKGSNKGKWTSKLGSAFCIIHGSPKFLEGKNYGVVKQYMKIKTN
jgi:hypothetical protein